MTLSKKKKKTLSHASEGGGFKLLLIKEISAFALDTSCPTGGIHLVCYGAPDGSPCIWGSSHSLMSLNGKFILPGVAVESLALHNNIPFSHTHKAHCF